MAKAIQYRFRADQLSQPVSRHPMNLNDKVRPELIDLGERITTEIYRQLEVKPSVFIEADPDYFVSRIDTNYVEEPDKKILFDALRNIEISR